MKKKLKILYEYKEASTVLDTPKVCYDLNDFVLELKYSDNKRYKIYFRGIFGFKYSSHPLCTADDVDAYDQIVEVLDSDWLKEFSQLDEEMTHTKKDELHHYMTYFDSEGVYEFIAKSFGVEEVKG